MAITDSLISYWALGEASGTRADSTATGNTLSDNGTVGQGAGIQGNCATFASASSQYLSHIDNASLSVGATDFAVAFWFKTSGATAVIVGKDDGSNREYNVYIESGTIYLTVIDSVTGSSLATTGAGQADNTWRLCIAQYAQSDKLARISINAGTENTGSAISNGVADSTAPFVIGAKGDATLKYDGSLDEVGFWKRTLTAEERTWLYNSGTGRSYADLVAAGGGVTAASILIAPPGFA